MFVVKIPSAPPLRVKPRAMRASCRRKTVALESPKTGSAEVAALTDGTASPRLRIDAITTELKNFALFDISAPL